MANIVDNSNTHPSSSSLSSSENAATTTTMMMMMPPRKLMPPVETFSSSEGSNNNNNNSSSNHHNPPSNKIRPSMTPSNNNIVGGTGGITISSKPTLLVTSKLRFLIMDAPRQSNLHLYIKECRRHHVTDIVRVCEPTYMGNELQSAGITLHEMAYDDGHSPPDHVLNRWLTLVEERFLTKTNHSPPPVSAAAAAAATTTASPTTTTTTTTTIAVHCVAGLGRAPVLVAIALMEYEKMDAVEAVMKIRSLRRGAINETQLQYLETYKCRRRYHSVKGGEGMIGGGGCGCSIL